MKPDLRIVGGADFSSPCYPPRYVRPLPQDHHRVVEDGLDHYRSFEGQPFEGVPGEEPPACRRVGIACCVLCAITVLYFIAEMSRGVVL